MALIPIPLPTRYGLGRPEACARASGRLRKPSCAHTTFGYRNTTFRYALDLYVALGILAIVSTHAYAPQWFLLFTAVIMVALAFLGFTNFSHALPLNDKMLHFVCLMLATGVFYFIFDVEE